MPTWVTRYRKLWVFVIGTATQVGLTVLPAGRWYDALYVIALALTGAGIWAVPNAPREPSAGVRGSESPPLSR